MVRPSSPAVLLTPIASLKMIAVKAIVRKNNGVEPSVRKVIVVKPAIKLECEEGMPPVTNKSFR